MGLFDKLANMLGLRKKECNILVVGLDNSGKSTVLNHFMPPETKHSDIVPTVGFNVERFKSRKKLFGCCFEAPELLRALFFLRHRSLFCYLFKLTLF